MDEEPGQSPRASAQPQAASQTNRGAPRSSATSVGTTESTSLAPEPEGPREDSPVMTWDVRPVSTKPKRRKRRYRFKLTSNMYSGPVLSAVNSGDKCYLTT